MSSVLFDRLDDGLRHALTCEYDAFRAAGHDYYQMASFDD